ncbi:MAG: hypothetical protein WAM46_13910, partial [Flavobacterium sp.]
SNGIEIEKSSWYQTVNIWVKQEHLTGEDLIIEIWDNDAFKNDYCKVINVTNYDGNLIPFTLDSYVKNKAGNWGMLYVKIGAPKLKLANDKNVFESKNHLDVEDKREIYSAQIGSQDAKQRHYHVDYNQVSYFYGKSRGIKAEEKLKITIYEKGKKLFEVLPPDVKVDTSGAIQATLTWDAIAQKTPSRAVYAVVQDGEDVILYNGAKTANGGVAITKRSALLGLAEYKSAVLVQKYGSSKKENKNCACECEARVRAFMRMLRVGEGTGELIKSYDKKLKKVVYIPHDFQKGYTTAYNNHKITDLSTHPQIIYDEESSAAGAYQIMRYVWWDLSGFEVVKKKKTGKYFENRNLLKKYNVFDYKADSQDKICLVIMKKQRSQLMKKIISNKIEEAIKKEGSRIWASLPIEGDISYYELDEKPQPATPLKICLEHYNKFLKEELAEMSNLHLKKGFLKEFESDCCDKETSSKKGCGDKDDIDLRSKMNFISQKAGSTNCGAIARNIVSQIEGIYAEGTGEKNSHAFFQLALENEKSTELVFDISKSQSAITYIDKSLEAGYPLRAGVNHTFDRNYNEDDNPTTDHYVVIVGRKCDNGVLTYLYWDVGTKRGESADYRFKLIDGYKLINTNAHGTGNNDNKIFTVTQIARNFKDGKII